MSKNNDILDDIGTGYLLYKFGGTILLILIPIIIIVIIMISQVKGKLDTEVQQYGYKNFNDNIKYDEWTDEIIPKNEIPTYNNDTKWIINQKGQTIYFWQLKEKINEYRNIQGNKVSINSQNKNSLDIICNSLLREYLDIDYEITESSSRNSTYYITIKNCVANGINKTGTWFGSTMELENLVKLYIKGIYREQHNLEPKPGY